MLPHWPAGTIAILATDDGTPHAIPVSAVVRGGDRRLLLALAVRRGSLARRPRFCSRPIPEAWVVSVEVV